VQVTILSHKGVVFEDRAERAEFFSGPQVLSVGDDHQPMVCCADKGFVRLFGTGSSGKLKKFVISDGVAFIAGNELKIIAETTG
jgi:F0F1-type ATP synthase epsilon subunit